jgi:hypothetical protein
MKYCCVSLYLVLILFINKYRTSQSWWKWRIWSCRLVLDKLRLRRAENRRLCHWRACSMAVISYNNGSLLMNVAWISLILWIWSPTITFLIERIVWEVPSWNIVWRQLFHRWRWFSFVRSEYTRTFRRKYVLSQILLCYTVTIPVLWSWVIVLKLHL